MYGFSLIHKFKQLDIYRKLPNDFVQPTTTGAMLSLISGIAMFLLFFNEFLSFREIKTSSKMLVDVNRNTIGDKFGDKLPVNIDIDLINFPCGLISFEITDQIGGREYALNGDVKLYNLYSEKGKKMDEYKNPNNGGSPSYEEIKKNIIGKNGCKIAGTFYIDKIPGSFHISSNAFGSTIQRLAVEGILEHNAKHIINTLTFGNNSLIKYVNANFKKNFISTLKGKKTIDDKETNVYLYYLKIVPSNFHTLSKDYYGLYQYSYTSGKENAFMQAPSIYFRYDISPITVEYNQYKMPFLTFFIQICAILGGVFTVTGIIDSIVHKSVKILLRKAELGKLM